MTDMKGPMYDECDVAKFFMTGWKAPNKRVRAHCIVCQRLPVYRYVTERFYAEARFQQA